MPSLPPESNIEKVIACYGISVENNDLEISKLYDEARKIVRKNFHARKPSGVS